ncbi:MAG: hypothetical protein ABIT38_17920, partial [Gemmatimonadaceae bacterium]
STPAIAKNEEREDVIPSRQIEEAFVVVENSTETEIAPSEVEAPSESFAQFTNGVSTSDGLFADVVSEHVGVTDEIVSAQDEYSASASDEEFDSHSGYARAPSFDTRAVETTPDAFVTETMAELYVQQGFVDDALGIYQQLLARSPHDETLRARIDALVAQGQEITASAPVVERAGQSARSFFAQFARREPRRASSMGENHLPLAEAGELKVATPAPESISTYSGVARREEALTTPDENRGNRSTSLEQLFGSRAQSNADESAAGTLAAAFDMETSSGGSLGDGQQELSLQHLFRDVPTKSASAVSLDEFFASTREETDAPNDVAPAGEQRADIEQFTAWLEGLKKK